jgi:hypothetical protein
MATTPTTPGPGVATAAEQMKIVKAAWDKAPAGPKKDAALKHYTVAENAVQAHDEKAALKALEEATKALH